MYGVLIISLIQLNGCVEWFYNTHTRTHARTHTRTHTDLSNKENEEIEGIEQDV